MYIVYGIRFRYFIKLQSKQLKINEVKKKLFAYAYLNRRKVKEDYLYLFLFAMRFLYLI